MKAAPPLLVDLRPDSERSAFVGMSTADAHRAAGGFVLDGHATPWAEINKATLALHTLVGAAYTLALVSEIQPEQLQELLRRARHVVELLEARR